MTYKSFYIFCACNVVKLSLFCDTNGTSKHNPYLLYFYFTFESNFICVFRAMSYTNYKNIIKLYKHGLYYFRNAIN